MRPTHDEPELPPAFDDLREQFRQAAAREIEVERRVAERARRGRRRTVIAVALALAVPAAGVAGAARIFSSPDKGPGKDPNAQVADAGIVPSSAFPDPDGGPPWALKVFASREGQECVAFGRLQGGKLGRSVGGEFRPLPERVAGVCGDLRKEPVLVSVSDSPDPPRTVVYGISHAREPVVFEARGRRHELKPGALGTFLLVLDGFLPPQSATVTWRDGDRVVVRRIP